MHAASHQSTGKREERGMLLYGILFLVTLVGFVSLHLIQETLTQSREVDRHEENLRALQIAEVGLLKAELHLCADLEAPGAGSVSGSYAGGTYTTEAVLTDADARVWTVTCSGECELGRRRIEVALKFPITGPRYAVFGREDVTFQSDSSTDSFDSRLGSYASQISGTDANGSFAGTEADAGSNMGIDLQGGAGVVRGNAIPGPFDTVSISAPAWVTGTTDPAPEEVGMPDPRLGDFQAAFAANDNGSLNVSDPMITYDPVQLTMVVNTGTELVLPAGTYFFRELALKGGSTLRVTGSVKLYITGELDLSGGSTLNDTGLAANLSVIAHPYPVPSTPPKVGVSTSGGSQNVMWIYAPGMPVTLYGGSEYFGAVVGRTVTLSGGSKIHYDLALRDGEGAVTQPERIYWRELDPPR